MFHATRSAILACLVAAPLSAVSAGAALAQSVQEAVRTVLRTHPDVLSAAANLRGAVAAYDQAAAGRFPTLDLRTATGREDTDSITTRALRQGTRSLQRQEASLLLRQPVYDGAQVRSEMERQSSRVESQRARLLESSEAVAFRATEAFSDALRDQLLVRLSEDNVKRHEVTLEKVTYRFKSGVGQRADVEQAQGRLALARSGLVGARGTAEDSATRYQRLMGRLPGELQMPQPPTRFVPPSLAEAVKIAADTSYGVKAARYDVESAQAGVRVAQSELLPKFDLELSVNRNRDLDGVRGPNYDNMAMMVFRYNLFRGGADQARVREAYEREVAASEAANNAWQSTEESVGRAWYGMVTTRDRLEHLESHVRATTEVLQAYQAQFELGRRSLLDVLNAESELFQARSSLLSGQMAHRMAQYRLLVAVGMLVNSLGLSDELAKYGAFDVDGRAPERPEIPRIGP